MKFYLPLIVLIGVPSGITSPGLKTPPPSPVTTRSLFKAPISNPLAF